MDDKISMTKTASVLKTAGATIRRLNTENVELREKLAAFELKEKAQDLAKEAEAKGLWAEIEGVEKKAEHILRNSHKLPIIEEAIKMSAASVSLGSLDGEALGSGGDSRDRLNYYLSTGHELE